MTERGTYDPDDSELRLPQGLNEDLRAAFSPGVHIPAEVDARVWSAARRHHIQQRRRRVFIRWARLTTAAAAAVALATWIAWPTAQMAKRSPSAPMATSERAPLLADAGEIDILAAFELCKRIQTHKAIDPSWDINHDGSINRTDVDLLAARAVSLEGRAIE